MERNVDFLLDSIRRECELGDISTVIKLSKELDNHLNISELKKEKLIRQLFTGKVTEIIGFDKTIELLKESMDAINQIK